MKSIVHFQQLLSGIICASHLTSCFDLTLSLCPFSIPLIISLSFCCPPVKNSPCLFPSPFSAFFPLLPTVSATNPPFLPSSPHLINSSDTVSHWCSHYNAQGASPLHLPVMDFQCFDHLTCHVVMSPPWVASLCKLFRNAWILSVLLYSFHHYSLPRQSSSARPPPASPAAASQTDDDCCCYVTTSLDWLGPKAILNRLIMRRYVIRK